MPEAPKSKTTVWIDQQDRDNMTTIKRVYRLASDSAAIRYALQQVARDARLVENGRLRQAVALLNSMVESGESHSARSRQAVREAMDE